MALVYRAMRRDTDGLPVVGCRSKELGVRVPPDANADVDVTDERTVVMNGRGMSVADHWQSLPPHLIPKRLRPFAKGAAGSDGVSCYRMGEGPFADDPVDARLVLVIDAGRRGHGLVCPSSEMTLDAYQAALADTRPRWIVDEEVRR